MYCGEDRVPLLSSLRHRFWVRVTKDSSPIGRKHFIAAFTRYMNSVVDQARDREEDSVRSVESYFDNRRLNIGALPAYIPGVFDLDIPNEAFYHPHVVQLGYCVADMIIIDNVGPRLHSRFAPAHR